MPLNDTYLMKYFNQNYHKLFKLSQTKRDNPTQPDEIMVQARCKAQHTS